MIKSLMKNTAHPNYAECAERVKRIEAKYGEDWEDTIIEYSSGLVSLPKYVAMAPAEGNSRAVLQWLGKGNVKERVNAKCEDTGNMGLLCTAAANQQCDLMSYLLLNGADVNILQSHGASVLTVVCSDKDDYNSKAIRLLLCWGTELFHQGVQMKKEEKLRYCDSISKRGNVAIAKLISSELGGRRCEIVSPTKTRSDLVGKTCVVEEYITKSNQYKVKMEFTNKVLLLGVDDLKRRDRTPQDPGYYMECRNNRLIRRDFKSNEECQAFVASLSADEDGWKKSIQRQRLMRSKQQQICSRSWVWKTWTVQAQATYRRRGSNPYLQAKRRNVAVKREESELKAKGQLAKG